MAKKENKIIKEAYGEYNVLTGDEEIKRLAEIRMLSEMQEQAALKASREEGRREEKKEGNIAACRKTAQKLIKLGVEISIIEEATGLTREEIEKLL